MDLEFNEESEINLILNDTKILHIVKDDENKWHKDMPITFLSSVTANDKVKFKSATCVSIQDIEFKWTVHNKGFVSESNVVQLFIDNKNITLDGDKVDDLIFRSGFKDRKDFFEHNTWNKKNFIGKIIHWTNKNY
jgi:hypothetical protein